ncbi:hypothetical protein BH18ACI4_BH18ACI4_19830 [soil metagenome]
MPRKERSSTGFRDSADNQTPNEGSYENQETTLIIAGSASVLASNDWRKKQCRN